MNFIPWSFILSKTHLSSRTQSVPAKSLLRAPVKTKGKNAQTLHTLLRNQVSFYHHCFSKRLTHFCRKQKGISRLGWSTGLTFPRQLWRDKMAACRMQTTSAPAVERGSKTFLSAVLSPAGGWRKHNTEYKNTEKVIRNGSVSWHLSPQGLMLLNCRCWNFQGRCQLLSNRLTELWIRKYVLSSWSQSHKKMAFKETKGKITQVGQSLNVSKWLYLW